MESLPFFLMLVLPTVAVIAAVILFIKLLKKKRRAVVWFMLSGLCSVVATLSFMWSSGQRGAEFMILFPPLWPLLAAPIVFSIFAVLFLFRSLMSLLERWLPRAHAAIKKSFILSSALCVFIILPVITFIFLIPMNMLVNWLGVF